MHSWIEVLVAIQSITQTEIKQAQLQALLLVEKKEEKTIRRFHFAIIYGTFVLGLMIEQKAHINNRKINKSVIVIILFIQKFAEFIILCYIYLNLYCR